MKFLAQEKSFGFLYTVISCQSDNIFIVLPFGHYCLNGQRIERIQAYYSCFFFIFCCQVFDIKINGTCNQGTMCPKKIRQLKANKNCNFNTGNSTIVNAILVAMVSICAQFYGSIKIHSKRKYFKMYFSYCDLYYNVFAIRQLGICTDSAIKQLQTKLELMFLSFTVFHVRNSKIGFQCL